MDVKVVELDGCVRASGLRGVCVYVCVCIYVKRVGEKERWERERER